MTINAASRLFVALDVPTIDEAHILIRELGPLGVSFKVGHWLSLQRGFDQLCASMKAYGGQAFLDFKLHDIPETMAAAIRAASDMGFDFATVHVNDTVDADAFIKMNEAKRRALKLLGVVSLTSNRVRGPSGFIQRTVKRSIQRSISRTRAWGLDGVVVPPDLLHEARHVEDFLVVCPGIRLPGSDDDDHVNPVTPFTAILKGTHYLVVGRPIVRSRDPVATTKAYISQMADGFHAIQNPNFERLRA